MNQDALERLRNRAKPTVQSRDLSTIPSVSSEQSSLIESSGEGASTVDIPNSGNQDVKISTRSTTIDANTTSPSSVTALNGLS